MNTQRVLKAAILAGCMVLPPQLAQASPYAITDLSAHGKLLVYDINNAGDIVGQVLVTLPGPPWDPDVHDPYVEYHGFVLSHGQLTELAPFGTPGGQLRQLGPGDTRDHFATSGAWRLNQQGQVAGQSDDDHTVYDFRKTEGREGFVYQNGQYTKLGDYDPVGINQQGQVVGNSGLASLHLGIDNREAKVYANGHFASLGTLGTPGSTTVARAINDQGQVTGSSLLVPLMVNPDGPSHAFLHDGVQMMDLGTLGGSYSEGLAINNAGQVTGVSTTADGAQHPFLYSDGQLIDLALLPALSDGSGLDINASGDVVGTFWFEHEGGLGQHAFLYRDGQMLDLNDLLDPAMASEWVLSSATAINDQGIIIGQGLRDGVASAFQLSAVPEPEALALMIGGLLSVAGLRPRRTSGQRTASVAS